MLFRSSCAGPVGFVCSAQGVGFTPDDVVPTDNPGLVNITWAYTSGPTIVGGNGAGPGVELGNFTAQSAFNASVLVSYAARGFKNNGPGSGTVSDNVGVVAAPSGVPEPLTMATMGLGLMILAIVRKSSK